MCGSAGAEASEDPAEVDVEQVEPAFVVEVVGGHIAGDRGVRNDHVQSAELRHGRRHHLLDALRVGDVTFEHERLAPEALDRFGDGSDVVLVAGVPAECDIGAGFGEKRRCCRTDTRCRARDKGDSAVQSEHCVNLAPRILERRRDRASVRARHPDHVLAEVGEDEVVRNGRHLVQPCLAELSLDVVLLREAEATMCVEAGVRGCP